MNLHKFRAAGMFVPGERHNGLYTGSIGTTNAMLLHLRQIVILKTTQICLDKEHIVMVS